MAMRTEAVRMQPIRLEKFLRPDSREFQNRAGRALEYLKAGLLRKHFDFSAEQRDINWPGIISDTFLVDLSGINGIRNLDKIINEIDAKSDGWILDRATSLMRELHYEIRKEHLSAGHTLTDFLNQPPADLNDKNETNFDPIEMLVRNFGYVSNFIGLGKKGYLLPARLPELEKRFGEGYIFLRAAHILSEK